MMFTLEDFERIVKITAVTVAGLWAYFRFFKARTLKPRLTISLRANIKQTASRKYVHTLISIKNLGLTRINLDLDKSRAFLFYDKGTGRMVEWSMLSYFPIIKNHEWLEPDETALDEQLIPIPVFPPYAMKLEVFVCSKGGGNAPAWTTLTIVTSAKDGGSDYGTDDCRCSSESH